ncbi:MAG: hypothetical protein ABIV47_04745 [Roseiflexaceae bacterium]
MSNSGSVTHLTLEQFLESPADQVAKVAPETLIYTTGGTRRSAALAGISPESDEYARWTRERMIACFDLFFRFGVRHIFNTLIRPNQFAEVGRYRERLLDWLDWGVAGPEALADYARLGWRVRLIGTMSIPELRAIAERLRAATPEQSTTTVWYHVISEPDEPWQWLLAAAQQAQARTQLEAIRALYGEDIPLAKLYLSFGKPIFVADLLPPLLAGDVQSYWIQRPGYLLDEQLLRRILYDYAYLRPTWTHDKSARYNDVEAQRSLWEQAPTLGLGQRVGAFWHPINEQVSARTAEDL